MKNVEDILRTLTLEEKASLCSGGSYWDTKAIPEKDIPSTMLTDGPHGLRKQDLSNPDMLGINASVPATCFPSAAMTANSWDESLLYRIGAALGEECQAENVQVVLGPGANIKRSPLCGRNFEYFSEDPFLSSHMAKSYINGVQSQGVGVSLKHFAVNNQETRRFTIDAIIDERALREIYLASFEIAVKEAKPWTVMAAYNKINGVHCCENECLLNDILRGEWGYEGLVVSDWSATNDQVEGIKKGFDLRMPYAGEKYNEILVAAVKSGTLSEAELDRTVKRILTLIKKGIEHRRADAAFSKAEHHALACEAAAESAVLLINNDVLPLSKSERIALIGGFAKNIRYQGGGSSHINPTKLNDLITAFAEARPEVSVSFARGYRLKKDLIDEAYAKEAVELAKHSDKVVLCLGLPYGWESEGYDRTSMTLPGNQIDLLERLAETGKPIIVLMFAGAPVEMPWIDKVDALFAMYTGGQAVCDAAVKLLYGDVNPCGKLAETYPLRMEHSPCSLSFPQTTRAVYEEGIFVGYRYYEKKKLDVLFPFGFGLSYTTWKYSNLQVDKDRMTETDTLTVSVDITNTGATAGKEIVELYVGSHQGFVSKPAKELKGFAKVYCAPGETQKVVFGLNKRSFAHYDVDMHDWMIESGAFQVLIGAASNDIRLQKEVFVESVTAVKKKYTPETPICEILSHPVGAQFGAQLFASLDAPSAAEATDAVLNDEDINVDVGIDKKALLMDIPLGKLGSVTNGLFTDEAMMGLLYALNLE